MSAAFTALRQFIEDKMRMSHIYQPVMLEVLFENGGRASARQIAARFLAHDESQLDYYRADREQHAGEGSAIAWDRGT